MNTSPKARCPACDRMVAIGKGGVFEQYFVRSTDFAATVTQKVCRGSGRQAVVVLS